MAQGYDRSMVICYYANPKAGKVEKHFLPAIVFEEASRGRMVENRFVVPEDGDCWSLDPPEGVAPNDIDDRTPKAPEEHVSPGQPPPAFSPRTPQPLKGLHEPAPSEPMRPAPASARRR